MRRPFRPLPVLLPLALLCGCADVRPEPAEIRARLFTTPSGAGAALSAALSSIAREGVSVEGAGGARPSDPWTMATVSPEIGFLEDKVAGEMISRGALEVASARVGIDGGVKPSVAEGGRKLRLAAERDLESGGVSVVLEVEDSDASTRSRRELRLRPGDLGVVVAVPQRPVTEGRGYLPDSRADGAWAVLIGFGR